MSNDIFENQEEVFDNIRESAKALGAEVRTDQTQMTRLVAKKKCKWCYGKGTLTYSFPGNDGNESVTLVYCKCVKQVGA